MATGIERGTTDLDHTKTLNYYSDVIDPRNLGKFWRIWKLTDWHAGDKPCDGQNYERLI
jgi:hypothetical protein